MSGFFGAGSNQPLDSDLTAIAALTTTAFGRGLLDDADAAAALTTLGVSSFAQTILDDANAATARATLGLFDFTGAKVRKASNLTGQNLTTPANILFDTEDYDVGGLHSTGANTDRLVPVTAGYYRLDGLLELANTGTGNYCRILIIRYNSSNVLQEYVSIQMMEASVTGTFHFSASGIANFSSGDYAVMQAHVEADTSVDITTTTYFAITRVG